MCDLYFIISILCYFLLLLHDMAEGKFSSFLCYILAAMATGYFEDFALKKTHDKF